MALQNTPPIFGAQPLSIELTAVSGLATTGISRRTGAGTWTAGTTVTVAEGGTGAATLTGLIKGTGTTAMVAAVAATDYVAPSAYASANGHTMATARILGRTTAATGAAEEISIGSGLTLSAGVLTATGGSTGTVTSVGLTATPPLFAVTGSPVTTAGTLNLAFATQLANTVLAGPTSGGALVPTMRALVLADLPTGYLFSNLGSIPTTLAGHGITDGISTGTGTAGTLVKYTGAGTAANSLLIDGIGTGALTLIKTGVTARSATFQDLAQTVAALEATQVFTGVDTFRNAAGVRTEAAATQDAVILAGRAGGTTSLAVTITPASLTSSRTLTAPDASGTIAITGSVYATFDWSNSISVTTTATATIGRVHLCTGTTANYALTLPTAVGVSGQVIAVIIGSGMTRLLTVTGNVAELIDGVNARIMWAGEVAILVSNGVGWIKIGGKSIPMSAALKRTTVQSIAVNTWTQIVMDTSIIDNTSGLAVPCTDTTNGRFKVLRPGKYVGSGFVSLSGSTTGVEVSGGAAKNAASPADNPNGFTTTSTPSTTNVQMNGTATFDCAAGDWIGAVCYQSNAGAINTRAVGTVLPTISVSEVITW